MRLRLTVWAAIVGLVTGYGTSLDAALPPEQEYFEPPPKFPAEVKNLDGETIDVAALVSSQTVVVVTLKATWCPVCHEQLIRLKERLDRVNTFNVTFLVLSPGPGDELAAVKRRTAFPYPFIEDENLRIAKRLNLHINDELIQPCIFILNRDREIRWLQWGRNGWYFGDKELLQEIGMVEWI